MARCVRVSCIFSRIKCGFIYISITVWVWSEVLKRIFNYPHLPCFGSRCGVDLYDVSLIPKPGVALQRLQTFGHESRLEVAWKKSLKHKRCWDWVHSSNWVKPCSFGAALLISVDAVHIYDTCWHSAFLIFKETAVVQVDVSSWYRRL